MLHLDRWLSTKSHIQPYSWSPQLCTICIRDVKSPVFFKTIKRPYKTSHFPNGFLVNTTFWLSFWVYLTLLSPLICCFHFWNGKRRPKGHLNHGGGEGRVGQWRKFFWRGPGGKYAPNACSWELLVWSGVIWGRFEVILVISECRITVCNKMYCQILKRFIASIVSNWLQIVSSPNRFEFCTSLICTLGKPKKNIPPLPPLHPKYPSYATWLKNYSQKISKL